MNNARRTLDDKSYAVWLNGWETVKRAYEGNAIPPGYFTSSAINEEEIWDEGKFDYSCAIDQLLVEVFTMK